jgi:hypothetical protein
MLARALVYLEHGAESWVNFAATESNLPPYHLVVAIPKITKFWLLP